MGLKQEIIKEIQGNKRLKRALMDYFDNSQYTIEKWLKENSRNLTEFNCLQIIGAYLKYEEITDLVDSSIELQKQP